MHRVSVFIAVTLLVGGCAAPQPYVSPDRLERGLVVVLPGVEGRSWLNEAICEGLNEGGVNWAIELHDWTAWGGPLYNLRNHARNRRKAEELADRIVRYQMQCPNRPVVLVGHSGGAAIAVWAAAALPTGTRIDGVVLLSAALSPRHTLDRPLRNSRRGIVNFYSSRDWVLLGTVLAGTMDGDFANSAGRAGFAIPDGNKPPAPYERLFQIAWNEKMAETGHRGGHLTSGAADFVSTYVAPFVRRAEWSREFVTSVLRGEAAGGAPDVLVPEWKPARGPQGPEGSRRDSRWEPAPPR